MKYNRQKGSAVIWVLVIVVIIIAIWAVYHFMSNTASAPTVNTGASSPVSTGTTASSTTSAPAQNMTMNVDIKNFAFNPATVTVKAGTTVTWTNEDTAPHTVTSDAGSILNSLRLSQGQSFSFTFKTPGTYTYHCTVHPMMKGTVIVE